MYNTGLKETLKTSWAMSRMAKLSMYIKSIVYDTCISLIIGMLSLSGFMTHKLERLSVHSFFKGISPASGIGQISFLFAYICAYSSSYVTKVTLQK